MAPLSPCKGRLVNFLMMMTPSA